MVDLSTTYLGLKLDNPVVVASCGFTRTAKGIAKCAAAGAGAVVLKSIFEEEILRELDTLEKQSADSIVHPEAADYIGRYGKENAVQQYLDTLKQAKKQVDVPLIASVNCVSAGSWIDFAERLQEAGADAIELNLFVMPSNPLMGSAEYEKIYFDIVKRLKQKVQVPVALKVGYYFSSLSATLANLSKTQLAGLVLFNRFRAPDFDIDNMAIIKAPITSEPSEYVRGLRWISILFEQVECDLCATTGIHDGQTAIKFLLAGASAVQICSTLYKNGLATIGQIKTSIATWMSKHGYDSIADFKGELSRLQSGDPAAFDRVQFMKE